MQSKDFVIKSEYKTELVYILRSGIRWSKGLMNSWHADMRTEMNTVNKIRVLEEEFYSE